MKFNLQVHEFDSKYDIVKTGMPEGLNKRCCTFLLFFLSFFLSMHSPQQPHRGRPCIPDVQSWWTTAIISWTHKAVLIVGYCPRMSDYRQKYVTSVHARCKFVDGTFDTPVVQRRCLLNWTSATCPPVPISYCPGSSHPNVLGI